MSATLRLNAIPRFCDRMGHMRKCLGMESELRMLTGTRQQQQAKMFT